MYTVFCGKSTYRIVVPPIGRSGLIHYHFGMKVANASFFEETIMNTDFSTESVLNSSLSEIETQETKAQTNEEPKATCKNGICELNWHPQRPQAA